MNNTITYPSHVDAARLAPFGWAVAAIDNYALAVTRDGVTLEVEYSRASNGVMFGCITRGGESRPMGFRRRSGQSAREAFLEIAEIMAR